METKDEIELLCKLKEKKFWGQVMFSTTYLFKAGEVYQVRHGQNIEESKQPKNGGKGND